MVNRLITNWLLSLTCVRARDGLVVKAFKTVKGLFFSEGCLSIFIDQDR